MDGKHTIEFRLLSLQKRNSEQPTNGANNINVRILVWYNTEEKKTISGYPLDRYSDWLCILILFIIYSDLLSLASFVFFFLLYFWFNEHALFRCVRTVRRSCASIEIEIRGRCFFSFDYTLLTNFKVAMALFDRKLKVDLDLKKSLNALI